MCKVDNPGFERPLRHGGVGRLLIVVETLILAMVVCSCSTTRKCDSLQSALNDFVKDKDATIGIAVIVDGKDTVAVNGDKPFPMLSVYKLPIALALGDYLRFSSQLFTDRLTLTSEDLRPDTYSPMREKYAGRDSVEVTLHEVLAYALQQSDNNASDMLLKIIGGTDNVALALGRLGSDDIHVVSTEDEMHGNPDLCYKNTATPVAMAKLIDKFDRELNDPFSRGIKQLMETCETGRGRLAKPLLPTNAVIGHKTGTGFILPDGRLMAVNDVGYVHLPNGHRYAIAVFVEKSGYDMSETEALIANISEIVFKNLMDKTRFS